MTDTKTIVIAYCDGEACSLTEDPALILSETGYGNVKVLINGWTVWTQNGYPAEQGGRREPYEKRPFAGWLTLIARLFIGGVFIYASMDKILHPATSPGRSAAMWVFWTRKASWLHSKSWAFPRRAANDQRATDYD